MNNFFIRLSFFNQQNCMNIKILSFSVFQKLDKIQIVCFLFDQLAQFYQNQKQHK